MHAPQNLEPRKKSKSMSTSFIPRQKLQSLIFIIVVRSAVESHFLFKATMPLLLSLNARLLLVDTAYSSSLSVRIVTPICCPSRESTWQPYLEYGPNQIKGDM